MQLLFGIARLFANKQNIHSPFTAGCRDPRKQSLNDFKNRLLSGERERERGCLLIQVTRLKKDEISPVGLRAKHSLNETILSRMVFGGKWWPGRYTFGNVNRDTLSGGSFQFCERKRKEKWKKDFLFKGTLKGQGSQIVSISCTKQVQCFFRHAHELRWKCWNGDEMILILVAQDYEIICIIYVHYTYDT